MISNMETIKTLNQAQEILQAGKCTTMQVKYIFNHQKRPTIKKTSHETALKLFSFDKRRKPT